jgi:tetratricopeptide (TPR) repeat protein
MGDEHPESIEVLECHAAILGNLGRWQDVVSLRIHAFRAQATSKGELAPETLKAAHKLAEAHLNTGNASEAEALCRRIVTQREAILGDSHPDTLASVCLLISILGENSESEESVALRRRLIEAKVASGEKGRQAQLALDINNLSVSLKKKKLLEEAEALARKALALEERARGASHPKIPHRLSNLAILLIANGKVAEAERQLERAWLLKEGGHDLTSSRILYLKLAIAFVRGQSENGTVGRLKTLLSSENLPDHANVTRTWDIQCVIDYLQGHLSAELSEFMERLSEVLNQESPASSLERFPDWRRVHAVAVGRNERD